MPRLSIAFLILLLTALTPQKVFAQPEKPRLAIREIQATDPVLEAARAQGQSQALAQIIAATDSQLIAAITNSRRFDIVARSDLKSVLKEQGLAESGLVDPQDPQTARAYSLAGTRFVVALSVDNFQDAVAEAEFSGGLGRTTMERRTIQMLATLKIYDTTTAVLLETASLRIEEADVRETLPGATQDGRLTNALLGRVAEKFARDAANSILNRLAPASVLAYTAGQITLNRADGTGIAPGQYWRIYHVGPMLYDPQTGEALGAEEFPVGWARITEVTPRMSKAQAIEDTGISIGSVLRYAPDGLPADVNPDGRATGSARPIQPAPQRTNQPAAQPSTQPAAQPSAPTSTDSPNASADATPMRVAVFVRITDDQIPDRHTDAIETWITSALAGEGTEIISRAMVLGAISGLSDDGANRGSQDPQAQAAARLLSDQASALSMARTLGADALLIATAADLTISHNRFTDADLGIESNITSTSLSIAWTLISGQTGGAIASGHADASDRVRASAQNQQSPTVIGSLIKDASTGAARQARRAVLANRDRPAAEDPGQIAIRVTVVMEDISVPEIRKVDGTWVVTADRYLLQPSACDVMIDGFLAGTAPGEIPVTPGPHRLRIERPGLEPVDRFIVAREGMELTIPMQLSEVGRQRWMEHSAFIEGLKDGDALRENEQAIAQGIAEFLSSSSIVVDTSSLESLTVTPGTVSLWAELITR